MSKRLCIFLLLLTIQAASISLKAQDAYSEYRANWLQKAKINTPELLITEKKPKRIVTIIQDNKSFQGWKVIPAGTIDAFYTATIDKTKPVIIDFQEHITGYFSFAIKPTNITPDAPVRLKFTFGEVPSEIIVPFDPYKGSLSRAWLQDEIVTVMTLPDTITIPR